MTGVEGVDYAYDLAFEPISEATETDVSYSVGGLTIMVPLNSIDKLRGATLDLTKQPHAGWLGDSEPEPAKPARQQ